MQRIAEPELMTETAQVEAYARADFDEPHQHFIELLKHRFPQLPKRGTALDLGCGPGDIACRFARAFPGWCVHGLDGSQPMLEWGQEALRAAGLGGRVDLRLCHLPDGKAPLEQYDLVYSNSLLHHLANPGDLWRCLSNWSRPSAPMFVMDLLRPETPLQVQWLVEQYSDGEPEILRRDFANSLFAAYRSEEVLEQLEQAGLSKLRLEVVSDRHFLVSGRREDGPTSRGM